MKKILVIEDTAEVRENLVEIFEHANYKVVTAENGKTGLALISKELPDLIICDIMMPVLDGFGVLHLIQKNPSHSTIPFIFLTAKTERADIRKGMEMGADDFFFKPFDVVEMLKAVEMKLEKSKLLRSSFSPEKLPDISEKPGMMSLASFISEEREIQKYKKRSAVYIQGNRPSNLYYVVEGKVKAFKRNENGKEIITEIYKAGDFLGYAPLLEEAVYADNAEALEPTKLILIEKEEFKEVIDISPKIRKELMSLLAKNLSKNESRLINLAYNSVRKRVAECLLQITEKYKEAKSGKTRLRIRREDFAQVVGVAKESLIRTLADFKNEKLIDIIRGEILILKESKLKEIVN